MKEDKSSGDLKQIKQGSLNLTKMRKDDQIMQRRSNPTTIILETIPINLMKEDKSSREINPQERSNLIAMTPKINPINLRKYLNQSGYRSKVDKSTTVHQGED